MDFRVEQRLNGPVEQVEAALVDRDFIARLDRLPKVGQAELLEQHEDGDIVEQEVRFVFTGELSAAVRAVLDPRKISWVLESRFDLGTHESTWRILPDHYHERLTAAGSARLVADGDVTRRLTRGQVKVHMALVGGRVERAIVTGLQEHAEAEAAELNRFLHEPHG